MPGCVLRVSGERFLPDPLLARLSFKPYLVFRKGEERLGRTETASGFAATVSDRDGADLAGQVADALAFLKLHAATLGTLAGEPSVDDRVLDFGIFQRIGSGGIAVQCDRLPADLLRAAGAVNLDVEITQYESP